MAPLDPQQPRRRKRRHSPATRLIALLFLGGVLAGAVLLYLADDRHLPAPLADLRQHARHFLDPGPASRTAGSEGAPADHSAGIPQRLEDGQVQPAPQPDIPPTAADKGEEGAAQRCAAAIERLLAFCDHLDSQQYLEEMPSTTSARTFLTEVIEKLASRPPAAARETDDLLSVLMNRAHLFRVLGKDTLKALKAMVEGEGEALEAVSADLFTWTTGTVDCAGSSHLAPIPLAGLYDYASFFLNTLGGQSYLFRRDPRIRMLTTYYAVLIIDHANRQGINRHGIDIRPFLRPLAAEIAASGLLKHRQSYLQRIADLEEDSP